MYLSGISEIIIQRIGRWESFAFLDYIREQDENFTQGAPRRMLKVEKFQHLNDNDFIRNGKISSNEPISSGGL